MDLEALRALVTVVEVGSLVGAARRLGMTRPTLRRRIDALEAHAGKELLVRTRAGATPTEAGAVLAERGRLLLQEASALVASVREIGEEPEGTLRVMAPVGLPPQLVTPIMATLRSRYPRLAVHLRTADDPVRSLLSDVDLAVHFGERSPEGPWTSIELGRIDQWLVASPALLAARGAPACIDDLEAFELLSWACPGEDPAVWPLRGGGEVRVSPALISSDIHLLREAAAHGLGIACLPDARLPDPGPPLVPVLPEVIGRTRTVRIVVPAALEHLPRIRAVLDEVRRLRSVFG